MSTPPCAPCRKNREARRRPAFEPTHCHPRDGDFQIQGILQSNRATIAFKTRQSYRKFVPDCSAVSTVVMKFRALAWDYHAEAAVVESNKKQRRPQQQEQAISHQEDEISEMPGKNPEESLEASVSIMACDDQEVSLTSPDKAKDKMALQISHKQTSRDADLTLPETKVYSPEPYLLPQTTRGLLRPQVIADFDAVWKRVNSFPLLLNHPWPRDGLQTQAGINEPPADATTRTDDLLSAKVLVDPTKKKPPDLPLLKFVLQVAWTLHCSTTIGNITTPQEGQLPSPPSSAATAKTLANDQGDEDELHGMQDSELLKTAQQNFLESQASTPHIHPRDGASVPSNELDGMNFSSEQGKAEPKAVNAEDRSNPKETASVATPARSQYDDDDSDDFFWQNWFEPDSDSLKPAILVDCRHVRIGDAPRNDQSNHNPSLTRAGAAHATGEEMHLPPLKKSRVSFHESTRGISSSLVPSHQRNSPNEVVTRGEDKTIKSSRKKRRSEGGKRKEKKCRKEEHADEKDPKDRANNSTGDEIIPRLSVPTQSTEAEAQTEPTTGSSNVGRFMKLWKQRGAELQKSKDNRLHAQTSGPRTARKPERLPARTVTASKKRFRTEITHSSQSTRTTGTGDLYLLSASSTNNSRQVKATFSQDDSVNYGRYGVHRLSKLVPGGTEQQPRGHRTGRDQPRARNDSARHKDQNFQHRFHPQQPLPGSFANEVTDERLRFENSYVSTTTGARDNAMLVTPSDARLRPKTRESLGDSRKTLRTKSNVENFPDIFQRDPQQRRQAGEVAELPKEAQVATQDVNRQSFRSNPMPRKPVHSYGVQAFEQDCESAASSRHAKESLYSGAGNGNQPSESYISSGAFVDDSKCQEIVKVYCAERFVESWPNVVGQLCSGGLLAEGSDRPIPTHAFDFLDTPLVDKCSIDIELSSKSAISLCPLSFLMDYNTCKESVIDVAALMAVGRYENLFVILVLDDRTSSSQARSAQLLLQAATIQQGPAKRTATHIKTATCANLSESITEIILATNTASDLVGVTVREQLSAMKAQRVRFLLTMVPTMSVSGAVQALTIGTALCGGAGAGLADIVASERTRQQISLRATSESARAADVPAVSIVQLSHTSRADLSARPSETSSGK